VAVGPYGALLDAVRGVRWPARRPVPGGAPGAHQARTRGIAPEFAEYRPYRQGDDPRRLDWKLLARSDRAFIRLAPDHAILGTTFVVDASASMAFPEHTLAKWQLAKRLTVALAAIAHASADPVGLTVVAGAETVRLEPRTRRGVVAEIARTLDAITPRGTSELTAAVTASAARCVVISDCLWANEASSAPSVIGAMARHRARGGESHLLHIVSRAELEPDDAAIMATDPEDARVERPLVPDTRAGYCAAFDAWRAALASRAHADGLVYAEVVDDAPVEVLVRRLVTPAGAEARR
jgi:uncharacterized protein (DUF58 family)